ncbi:FAD-dependent oxidoreductase [Paenibacillus sp. FSL W8-0194]|uniref:NAD(P)/FAD-dependent oxidoreductase n=1 Tax=Paenibacillus sp. FSL W8-0194 TaxID=2921711 RepID=UPI0030D7FF31
MILNSGNPAWPHTLKPAPEYPALDQDVDCDFLIVGGGMSGAMMAYQLAARHQNIVLIDKRNIGGGSTAANTGLLQSSNDKSLTSMIHTFGEEIGVAFYKKCEQSIRQIREICAKLSPELEFVPRSSLYFASSEDDVEMLREEYQTLRKYGFQVQYWDKQEIGKRMPFTKPAALYKDGDAEVNPYRLVHALVQAAAEQGAGIYEQTEAVHFEFAEHGVTCYANGKKIRANKVIFSMGYETQELKKDKNAVINVSYAVLTKPVGDLSDWHERCLIWETARPYLYMRTTPDNRIVAGGLDESPPAPEKREARLLHQTKLLIEEIRKLFPAYARLEADYAWASIFGTTHDGMPMVGPHPDYPNCYFIEAYGGNGTVYCMIAADLLGDELTGRPRPELNMFSLKRSSKPSPSDSLTIR